MKKIITGTMLILCILCFKQANAQLSISLNLNIDNQPAWGPTGYNHVDYYYFPDIDCYYYVPTQQFIYLNGSTWVYSSSLPPQYSNYDLYGGYKVVLNQQKPYLQDNVYRGRYASYKGHKGQAIIRDSHDPKYKKNNNRPGNHPAKPDQKHQPAQNHQDNHKTKPAQNHPANKPAGPKQGQKHTAVKPAQNHTAKRPAAPKANTNHSKSKPAGNHQENNKDDHKK
jgi:hypothetical protein